MQQELVCFKNINFIPLEKFDGSPAKIPTKNKISDRCFLSCLDKATEITAA